MVVQKSCNCELPNQNRATKKCGESVHFTPEQKIEERKGNYPRPPSAALLQEIMEAHRYMETTATLACCPYRYHRVSNLAKLDTRAKRTYCFGDGL